MQITDYQLEVNYTLSKKPKCSYPHDLLVRLIFD